MGLLRTAASLDETHVPQCAEAGVFYIPGERCVPVKMRLVCVCVCVCVCIAVFLYITACLQMFIVRAVRGSFTVSLNGDALHAHTRQ